MLLQNATSLHYPLPVAGVDEVGRGPLAGSVVAAAVIVPEQALIFLQNVKDSKKLTAVKREALSAIIHANCYVGLGVADESEILIHNILGATKLAMQRAVEALPQTPQTILVDGNQTFPANCKVVPIVKGDNHILEIAAASIIAKVMRDQKMAELHLQFPHYGWNRNVGYGTAQHLLALKAHGITPHHRVGFEPVKSMVKVVDNEMA